MTLTVAGQRSIAAAPTNGSRGSSDSAGSSASRPVGAGEFASALAASARPAETTTSATSDNVTVPSAEQAMAGDTSRGTADLPGLEARALLALGLAPAAPPSGTVTATAADNTASAIRFLSQAIQLLDDSPGADAATAAAPGATPPSALPAWVDRAAEDSAASAGDTSTGDARIPFATAVPVAPVAMMAVPVTPVAMTAVPVTSVPVTSPSGAMLPVVGAAVLPMRASSATATASGTSDTSVLPRASSASSASGWAATLGSPIATTAPPASSAALPLSPVTAPNGAGSPSLAGTPGAAIRVGTEIAAPGVVEEDAASAVPIPSMPAPASPAPTATTAAPVPAAAPAAPAVPLAAQLFRPLFTLAGAADGEHTLTISVTPDDLGPVTVRAHISGDTMRIELFSSTDGGRDALRQIMTDLRRDLATSGVGADLSLSTRTQPDSGGTAGQLGQGNSRGGDADPTASDRAASDRDAARGTDDSSRPSARNFGTAPHGGTPNDSTLDVMA